MMMQLYLDVKRSHGLMEKSSVAKPTEALRNRRLNGRVHLRTIKEEVFVMSDRNEKRGQIEETAPAGSKEARAAGPRAHIEDRVRRVLCRVCQIPVVGEAPFCKDHELPVP